MSNHTHLQIELHALPYVTLTDDLHSLPVKLNTGGFADDLVLVFAHKKAFAEWFGRVESEARGQRLLP
jgi:hypothetical protein